MDVYKIWLASAPSMKSIELAMLSGSPLKVFSRRGSGTWLAQGLQIQQSQIQLRLEASSAGPRSTELQRLALARKRDWLGAEIQSFLLYASFFMGQIDAHGPEQAEQDQEDWIDEIGSEDDAKVAFRNLDPHHAEDSHLPWVERPARTLEWIGWKKKN
ncbi:hypothetical protein PAXRUDRAFT_22168 [Paxillus rubicundulus Ve08.2h10]|uniref:Uncharacterized protein n=1 Tax=Paxillus rubicundulus Ve08.2h10 TaxID=930991 RepID=A0A0D0CNI3_9AGAM|nr:hypothetical protein PAXRUDRAFT_22168 [Paxillus rubicundulus Ve08.2h10]